MKRLRAHPADPQNPAFLFSTRIPGSPRGATGNSRHIRLTRNSSLQPLLKLSSNLSQYSASSAASASRTPGGNGFSSVLPSDRVLMGADTALETSEAFSFPQAIAILRPVELLPPHSGHWHPFGRSVQTHSRRPSLQDRSRLYLHRL